MNCLTVHLEVSQPPWSQVVLACCYILLSFQAVDTGILAQGNSVTQTFRGGKEKDWDFCCFSSVWKRNTSCCHCSRAIILKEISHPSCTHFFFLSMYTLFLVPTFSHFEGKANAAYGCQVSWRLIWWDLLSSELIISTFWAMGMIDSLLKDQIKWCLFLQNWWKAVRVPRWFAESLLWSVHVNITIVWTFCLF